MMKYRIFLGIAVCMAWSACSEQAPMSSVDPVNWESRTVDYALGDSLVRGTSYLSVYSEIYNHTEHKTLNLTATISMRNTNRRDTIFLEKADYFDTKGHLIRSYFDRPVYIAPMETLEIVIDENDTKGGSGANFLFDWRMGAQVNEPLFEGVMVSTTGQLGLSFTTAGKRVH